MREEDEIHVNNIISCINEIEGYVEGIGYEDFAREEEIRQSVASNLQEIGEAAGLLSDDFVSQFTDIDYKVLETLKRAKYDEGLEVDQHAIWSIIHNDLPTFRDTLSTASEQLDFGNDEDELSGDFEEDDSYARGSYRRKQLDDDDDDFELEDDLNFDDDDFDDDDDSFNDDKF